VAGCQSFLAGHQTPPTQAASLRMYCQGNIAICGHQLCNWVNHNCDWATGVSHQKDMRTQLKLAGWLVIIFSRPSAQQCSASGVYGLVS